MTLNMAMKKIQKAIIRTGLVIKLGTYQFYSEEQKRVITVWTISTPVLQNTRNGWKMRDYEILKSASGVEIVKCLADIWESVKEWTS